MVGRIALLTAAASLMMAQAPQQQYSISGSVVNALTGEGVRRAVVHLNGSGPQRDAFTDASGRFEIPNVTEGRYLVTAQRPGFFDPSAQGPSQQPVWVDVNANTAPVTVKLSPQSVITGRITNENGEPLQRIVVQATEQQIANGRKTYVQVAGDSTDEDGTFELTDLQPGRYYLRAGPGFNSSGPARRYPDRMYLPVFFPAAPDRESAQALEVAAGQTVTADFRMTGMRVYAVTGITNSASQVSIEVIGADGEPIGLSGGSVGKPGQWMVLLPSGTWSLRATSVLPAGQNLLGESTVRVSDAPPSGVRIALEPLPTIPVRITESSDSEPSVPAIPAASGQMVFIGPGSPHALELRLQSEESDRNFYASNGPNNETVFYAVPPGRYRLVSMPSGARCIDSANAGGVDLSRDEYIVPAGGPAAPIDIAVGNDCGKLSVQIPASQPPGSSLVLTSDSPLFIPRTAPAINVSFGPLSPGTYHLYRVPTLDGLEYANPEVMRSYTAQDIVVGPGEDKKVTVDQSSGGSQ